MSREVHVRFCESLRVKFPRATRPDEAALPDEAIIASEEIQTIYLALKQLPAEYREVLVLRELEEQSYKQISEIIEIPIGTVMSRLSRARKKLREVLFSIKSKEKKHEV